MGEASWGDICSDANFQLLAGAATGVDELSRLLGVHVAGYTQCRRLLEGLKILQRKVEAAEEKHYMAKNLGKAAKARAMGSDQELVDRYTSEDLTAKVQHVSSLLGEMVEKGRMTVEERPLVRQQLTERRDAAKSTGKALQAEKLDNLLAGLFTAEPYAPPLPNLEEVLPLHLELQEARRLERRPEKSLSAGERALVRRRPGLEEAVASWSERGRMWFETSAEFAPRLEKALGALVQQNAERQKREAEELKEKRRLAEEEELRRRMRAEEEALEQKRQARLAEEERRARELDAKLEARRAEAALRPQKEAPQAKKKEKKAVTRLDNRELFSAPQASEDSGEAEEEERGSERAPPRPSAAKPKAPAAESAKGLDDETIEKRRLAKQEEQERAAKELEARLEAKREAAAAKAAKGPQAPPKKKEKVVRKKLDARDFFAPAPRAAGNADDEPEPAASPSPQSPRSASEQNSEPSTPTLPAKPEGPSPETAPAAAPVAAPRAPAREPKPARDYIPPPQPKKKESTKKKFAKVSLDQLGLDANNPNY